APVQPLGLLAVWDDGDDLHAEPRAPYPHVRDVLVLRAHAAGAALLVAGFARTAEAHLLVESGWAREVVADRITVRDTMPRLAPAAGGGRGRRSHRGGARPSVPGHHGPRVRRWCPGPRGHGTATRAGCRHPGRGTARPRRVRRRPAAGRVGPVVAARPARRR